MSSSESVTLSDQNWTLSRASVASEEKKEKKDIKRESRYQTQSIIQHINKEQFQEYTLMEENNNNKNTR